MAWKYKQEYVADGDVVEPSEWRVNINETVSELNGFLDTDNIKKDSIRRDIIQRDSFTRVYTNDLTPNNSYVFNHEGAGWITQAKKVFNNDAFSTTMSFEPVGVGSVPSSIDASVENMPRVTFTPDQDGLLICEFSGWVQWLKQQTNPDDLEDPIVVRDSGHEYAYFAKQQRYFKSLNAYILCSMWRLTVNGQSVAESGPLGNEYQSHPVYLCGATPILKNKETVVRLEGQFLWYSAGSDDSIQASSFSPKKVNDSTVSYRRDCSLNSPQLLVTYRKR